MSMQHSPYGAPSSRPADFAGLNGSDDRPVLITGGAGFIGTNLAHRFLSDGRRVILFDNLSRPGVEQNLDWLHNSHGNLLAIKIGDMRDSAAVRAVVAGVSQVFHFAAQVAVTTSLTDPIDDFEINARGTLNLLEALRAQPSPPPVIFTSSNKVYGDLSDVEIRPAATRYEPVDPETAAHGFGEKRPLDFHSPYGCSKGAAGQYMLDYARTFGLHSIVFHMSCIYGLHQCGNEDQGWVAHFLIRAIENAPITIYGDGKQVRDILFVDDLVEAFVLAQKNMDRLSGRSFNIGGGPQNTLSLLELLNDIEELHGSRPHVRFDDWRSADQQYYVSDIRKFSSATGWTPKIGVSEGIRRLYDWLVETRAPADRRSAPVMESLGVNATQRQLMLLRNEAFERDSTPRSKRFWHAEPPAAETEITSRDRS